MTELSFEIASLNRIILKTDGIQNIFKIRRTGIEINRNVLHDCIGEIEESEENKLLRVESLLTRQNFVRDSGFVKAIEIES